jgi:hypothetical protein
VRCFAIFDYKEVNAMKKLAIALSLVAAIAGLVAIGLHFDRRPSDKPGVTSSASLRKPDSASATKERSGTQDPFRSGASPDGGSVSGTNAGDASSSGRESPQSMTSTEWPSPISREGQVRVTAMGEDLRKADPLFNDLYTLLETEGRDANWSSTIEDSFNASLRANGRGYGGLEVSEPRCSKSICYISAVVRPGASAKANNTDWQRLILNAYNEPWFAENFVDARTTVGGDKRGAIYISFFERKR